MKHVGKATDEMKISLNPKGIFLKNSREFTQVCRYNQPIFNNLKGNYHGSQVFCWNGDGKLGCNYKHPNCAGQKAPHSNYLRAIFASPRHP